MKLISIVLILILRTMAVSGQLVFDADFENGRLDTVYQDSSEFVLAPISNLHFRLTQASQGHPVFKIFDSVGYQLRSYHFMVYRYEGEDSWHFFDTAYKSGTAAFYHFSNHSAFTKDTLYIAYWFPYRYIDLQDYLGSIEGSEYVTNLGVKGKTIQGRNLYGFEITDPAYSDCYKNHIVIVARQHPIESINGYFVEGFTDYLLHSTDSMATHLRRNNRFFIYPMLNPDGVAGGSAQNSLGQGLNREWEDGLIPGGTPEIDTIRPVIWEETEQRVDWFIDIHSNPGSNVKYYWWGFTDLSPVPSWQISKAGEYVQAVAMQDEEISGNGVFQNIIQGTGVNDSKTAANWFTETFNAISFTFEPTSEPLGFMGDNRIPVTRMKQAGQAMAQGFYHMEGSVQAMGGAIQYSGNALIATITGGFPPYTYTWSGTMSGNGDTLYNVIPGTYSLEINDSLGCVWSSAITIEPNAIWYGESHNIPLKVYPNPAGQFTRIETLDKKLIEQVWVYHASGKMVLHATHIGKEFYMLNLTPTPPGTYIVLVAGGDFMYPLKLIRL